MAARDEQHLYSVPVENIPTVSNNYNDLTHKPLINGIVLEGDHSLSDLGINVPTKLSQLQNDEQFITSADVPTKLSQLQNDEQFITPADVPTKLSQLQNDEHFITSADIKNNQSQTGTAQSNINDTIVANTALDDITKTLLNNDVTLAAQNQTLANSLAPIENGTNYSTTYYKNDEFWHNGVLCKVTASSVNSSTAINLDSGGNAIVISSFGRLHYVEKNISLTCQANSFTRVNVPVAAPETASSHRVAVVVQNEETVAAVLCGLGRIMLFTTATKTDASIDLIIWYQD